MEIKPLKKFLQEISDIPKESECMELFQRELVALSTQRPEPNTPEDVIQKQRFQDSILPYARQSDFCNYVYEKPRGYAGDFITQEKIWLGRTSDITHRYQGTSTTGRKLNAITLGLENCCANEDRIYRLQRWLKGKKRIISVGCGSCIEHWGNNADRSIEDAVFIDQDGEALNRAQKKVHLPPACTVQWIKANVLKFILGKNITASRDLVYTFGLLDYFSPCAAKRIVKGLWQMVQPGGKLIVTNAHPKNPTRLWMEYAGEWLLDYKDETSFCGLAEALDSLASLHYERDAFGCYQYLILEKN